MSQSGTPHNHQKLPNNNMNHTINGSGVPLLPPNNDNLSAPAQGNHPADPQLKLDNTVAVTDTNASNTKQLLNAYIYDFLIKSSLPQTAKVFVNEAEIPSTPNTNIIINKNSNLNLDINLVEQNLPNLNISMDAPQGFLYEWWQIFWDVFNARTHRGGSSSAQQYFQMQLLKQRQEHNLHGMSVHAAHAQAQQQAMSTLQSPMRNPSINAPVPTNSQQQAAQQVALNLQQQNSQILAAKRAAVVQQQQQQQQQQQVQQQQQAAAQQQLNGLQANRIQQHAQSQMNNLRQQAAQQQVVQQVVQQVQQQVPHPPQSQNMNSPSKRKKFDNSPNNMNMNSPHTMQQPPLPQQPQGVQQPQPQPQQQMMMNQFDPQFAYKNGNSFSNPNMMNFQPPMNFMPQPNGVPNSKMAPNGKFYAEGFNNNMMINNQHVENPHQPQPVGNNINALQDYQMQLMLLEKQNKKRLDIARNNEESKVSFNEFGMNNNSNTAGPNITSNTNNTNNNNNNNGVNIPTTNMLPPQNPLNKTTPSNSPALGNQPAPSPNPRRKKDPVRRRKPSKNGGSEPPTPTTPSTPAPPLNPISNPTTSTAANNTSTTNGNGNSNKKRRKESLKDKDLPQQIDPSIFQSPSSANQPSTGASTGNPQGSEDSKPKSEGGEDKPDEVHNEFLLDSGFFQDLHPGNNASNPDEADFDFGNFLNGDVENNSSLGFDGVIFWGEGVEASEL